MALAASGTMSLAGTATERSVQVALGGDGSTQISMNDAAVRALADKATGPVTMNDFHGKSAGGDGGSSSSAPAQYLPVSLSGTDSATDSAIPAMSHQPSDNVQITGTTFWRRVRLTSSQAGNFRLYVSPDRDSDYAVSQPNFRGDMQANMTIVTQSGTETEFPMLVGNIGVSGWEYALWTPTVGAQPTAPTAWNAVTTSPQSEGKFYLKTSSAPTGSSQTGRLQNFISTTTGYGYFEATSTPSGRYSMWLRSPQYTLAVGDTIDFYYGVDCAGLSSINFYLAA